MLLVLTAACLCVLIMLPWLLLVGLLKLDALGPLFPIVTMLVELRAFPMIGDLFAWKVAALPRALSLDTDPFFFLARVVFVLGTLADGMSKVLAPSMPSLNWNGS